MSTDPADLIVTDAILEERLAGFIPPSGGGVESVSGTVTLDATGEPIREFFTTGATTFRANGVDTPLGAYTAVVWRRTAQGSWGYQVVPDEWTTPTPTPDTTAPVAGTLAATVTDVKADLTVSGASDDRGVVSYSFSKDNGTTWTAYQSGATYSFTGLTAATPYTFRHKVKDGAGNETQGTAVTKATEAASLNIEHAFSGVAGSAVVGTTTDTGALTFEAPTSTGLNLGGTGQSLTLDGAGAARMPEGAAHGFAMLTLPRTNIDVTITVKPGSGNDQIRLAFGDYYTVGTGITNVAYFVNEGKVKLFAGTSSGLTQQAELAVTNLTTIRLKHDGSTATVYANGTLVGSGPRTVAGTKLMLGVLGANARIEHLKVV